jgi:aldose 1-epimerase
MAARDTDISTSSWKGSLVAPSGRQIALVYAEQRVVVTEVGGGLREYTVGGHHVIDGYGVNEMCSGGRGQVLVPWPNRLSSGRYLFEGADHQLPLSKPEEGNAIHGLLRWQEWQVVDHQVDRATVGHVIRAQPGYPFTLAMSIEYHLSSSGLAVTTTATNVGSDPLPYGAGFHPYLCLGTDRLDDATLQLPAATRIETDDRGIPTGRRLAVDGTPYDFREPRPVGEMVLDTCFTAFDTGADDTTTKVTLAAPDRARTVTVWMDRSFSYVMVFTGDTLAPARRRRSLAVEPMTCGPDAFNNGLGLQTLEPGAAAVATWGIEPSGWD